MAGYYDTGDLSLTGVARDPRRPLGLRISTDDEPPPARERLTAERRNTKDWEAERDQWYARPW